MLFYKFRIIVKIMKKIKLSKMSKNCQKVGQKLSKNCQKTFKKCQNYQKNVKKLSKL
jgi:hypothetical protein